MNNTKLRDNSMSKKLFVLIVLGVSSGLPLALTGSTLQAWLATGKMKLHIISLFTLVGLPYTIKFLWSPLLDRFMPPFAGRRRGWIALSQFILALFTILMSMMTPERKPVNLMIVAIIIAFVSATQDIVVDAYRTDILREKERGPGAGIFVTGYRIGMLISGAGVMILSEWIGWNRSYFIMGLLFLLFIPKTLLSPEPEYPQKQPLTIKEAVVDPFKDFLSKDSAIVFLFAIILYKFGDAFAGSITTAFLIRGAGFTPAEVGAVNKGFGLIATLLGALIGGSLMVKLGLFRSLVFFGILQGVSNLSFAVLAEWGRNYPLFVFTIGFENICGGMGTSAFIAFLMALCNKRYSATQYALLSSLSAIGRVFITPLSGFLVEALGWANFFILTFFTAIPGLILLWIIRNTPLFKSASD